MATKAKGSRPKIGGPGARKKARARSGGGARESRSRAAAREVKAFGRAGGHRTKSASLRQTDEHQGVVGEAVAANFGIGESMLDDLQLREEAAQHELARRAQEVRAKAEHEEPSRDAGQRDAPGVLPGSFAREVTEGAFRLGFTLVMTPLRIAVALLRERGRDEKSEPGD